MERNKKVICVIVLILMFMTFFVINIYRHPNERQIVKVNSPVEFILDNGEFKLDGFDTFDQDYTNKNKFLAQNLGISENEAFILGNFGKYWAQNILDGRKVAIKENDIIYYRFGYIKRFKNSAFYLQNGRPANKFAFEKQLKTIRKGNFVLVDLDSDKIYPISKENTNKLKNFVIVRKSHVKSDFVKRTQFAEHDILRNTTFKNADVKIVVSDLTSKIIPDRNCSSDICKEILLGINNAKTSIDMAIYGYSSTPVIEQAFKNAIARGVKIRVIYDIDAKGNNIYPDTFKFVKMFNANNNDKNSAEVRNTMHNKFYIFDNKKVITGSANLSHTDMSGYNSNSIIVINSNNIAEFYTQEFNQMFSGKYHNDKVSIPNKSYENIKVYFSPQDKAITNGVLPLIKGAKKYIYIPSFVITEKRITHELINAKHRGVDVKIIADALNSSTQHSKSKELRSAGILVKAENYAGKMHSKSMIIDDRFVIIGSMNFSNSGENKNDENLIILEDSGAAKFYKEFFLYQWNKIPDKWLKFTPRAESKDSIGSCSDGLDNNYDGKTDMQDEACREG